MAQKGTCSKCGAPAIHGAERRLSPSQYTCQSCVNAQVAQYTRRIRAACSAALGGECCECGFDDPRAFQIDHLNGGGRQHRMSISNNARQLYRHVLDHLDEYQLLCANCNQIKRIEVDNIRKVI